MHSLPKHLQERLQERYPKEPLHPKDGTSKDLKEVSLAHMDAILTVAAQVECTLS